MAGLAAQKAAVASGKTISELLVQLGFRVQGLWFRAYCVVFRV